MGQQTGVEQRVVVVGFTTGHCIGRGRQAVGDPLLLCVANEIIHLVFGVLVAHAAAQGKHRIDVVAGLHERCQVSGGIARVAADVVGILQRHPARLLGLRQIEELLVGIEAFMVGIEAVGQRKAVDRLAVQGQLAAVEIGFLLRSADAGYLAAAQGRERIEGQRLITIIHLRHQILAPEIGVGVLQVDQMALGAWNTIRIQITAVVGLPAAGHRREVLPQIQAVLTV